MLAYNWIRVVVYNYIISMITLLIQSLSNMSVRQQHIYKNTKSDVIKICSPTCCTSTSLQHTVFGCWCVLPLKKKTGRQLKHPFTRLLTKLDFVLAATIFARPRIEPVLHKSSSRRTVDWLISDGRVLKGEV